MACHRSLGIAAAILAATTAPAYAATLSPAPATITIHGGFAVWAQVKYGHDGALMTFTAQVDKNGAGHIVAIQSGSNIVPTGLPWVIKASGPGSIKIEGAAFTLSRGGICGPGDIKAHLSGGVMQFPKVEIPGYPSACKVWSQQMTTTPTLSITP